MAQFHNFKRFIDKVDKYGMKSGIVKVIPPAEWYIQLTQKACELLANSHAGATLYRISRKPSSRSESRIQSHKSSQASTVYTQERTLRSSDRTIFQNGGQSQMSRTTNRPRSEVRHVRAGKQTPQRAHVLHEPLQRPTMARPHRSVNLADLHVDDVVSRRRKRKKKRTTALRPLTSLLHLHRLVQKMRSQQSVVVEQGKKTRQRGLAVVNPGLRMRRSRCLRED